MKLDATNITAYATALKRLNTKQAELVLSTQGLTVAQKQAILSQAELLGSTGKLTTAELNSILVTKKRNKDQAEALLINTGLITSETAEATATNVVTAAKLKELVATGKLTQAEANLIATKAGVTLANQKESTSLLTGIGTKIKGVGTALKGLGTGILTIAQAHPVIAGITATLALCGGAALANKIRQEKAAKAIKEAYEEAKKAIDEINSTFSTNSSQVKEISKEYAELAQGVDLLTNSNKNLTTEKHERFLELSNQLSKLYPSLTKSFDKNGNAILDLSGDVNTIVGSIDDLIERQRVLANQEIMKQMPDLFAGYSNNVSECKKQLEDAEKTQERIQKAYEEINKYGLYTAFDINGNAKDVNGEPVALNLAQYIDLLEKLGITAKEVYLKNDLGQVIGFKLELEGGGDIPNLSGIKDAYVSAFNKATDDVKYAKQQLEAETSSINQYLNTWLQTEFSYNQIEDSGLQTAIQSMLFNFDWSSLPEEIDKNDWEAVSEYLRRNILFAINNVQDNNEISAALSEIFSNAELTPDEKSNYLKQIQDYFGEDNIITISLKPQIEETDILQKQYDDAIQYAKDKFDGYDPTEFFKEYSINTQDEIAFWNQCIEESATKEEAMEKYLASKFANFDDDTLVPTISSSISTIATQLEPQFTELGKLYNEIFQTDDNGNVIFSPDSVNFSTLESLRKSFKEIGEEIGVTFDPAQLDAFLDVLYNRGTEQEVQQAFNDLATAYLYSTDTLEQLNEETANAIEKQLAEMGVTNAHEVVLNALSEAKLRAVLAGYDLSNASSETMAAILNEGQAAGITEQMVYALTAAEIAYGDNDLSTEEKIDKLKTLAQAYGDVTTSALATTIANDLASGADIDPEAALAEIMDNFGKYKVDIDFSSFEKSVTGASSSAAKQAEKDWKNVLDKETDLLEKQLAANVITFKEYTDKRRQIIEDYYRDGKIKAEEYYDALESMYSNQLSLYDRVVNAVTNRIDDEIDKLKDQKEAIENSYQVRIDAIQEEIDALNKANDARQKQIDLEKAQYEAERARNQRVNKVYDGSQFVYAADMDAVRDAEDDLADKEFQMNISQLETQIELLKEEMENATKSLDNQIDALESYKDKWNEISDVYQKQQDKLLAAEIMGSEWERDILNGRLDTLRNFTEQYIALQQAQIDIAAKAAKIKAEAEAGNVDTPGKTPGGPPDDPPDGDDPPDIPPVYDRKRGTFYIRKYEGYASGTDHAKKGLNLVGEDGTETFIDNDGNVALVTKPTLIPMEGGEVVKNAEETKAMLDTGNIEPVQSEGMRALFERIRNMQPSDFSFQSLMQPLSAMVNFPNMDYSHMLHNTSAEPTPVVQHITLTLPNVTNNSGADYLIKTLERLPLDNLQHMHRRKR